MKDLTNDLLLKKHSSLIQINSKMTLQQRKLFNIILLNSNLNKWDKNNLSYIEIRKIKEMLGITHKNNKYIKDNLKKIKDVSIEYNLLEKDKEVWGCFSLIQEPEIKNGILSYSLPYRIRETIETGKPPFTLLDMKISNQFINKYSIIFYELFTDYYSDKLEKLLLPKLTINQLKILLGINEKSYAVFKDLKKYVLKKSIDELKKIAKMDVTYKYFNGYIKFDVKIEKQKKIDILDIEKYLKENDDIIENYKGYVEENNRLRFKKIKEDNNIYSLIFEEDGFEIEVEIENEDINFISNKILEN